MNKLLLIISLLLVTFFSYAQEEADPTLELQQARKSRAEHYSGMSIASSVSVNPLEQIRGLGHEKLDSTALFDKRVVAILQNAIKQSNFHRTSREEMKSMILVQVKGKEAEKLFEYCPKCLDISADILRDKDALPALLGIFARKTDLKKFGVTAIALFILGLILRWTIVNRGWKFFRRLLVSTIISLGIGLVTINLFYFHFRLEVGPSWKIIKSHF